MNMQSRISTQATALLKKKNAALPAFKVTGRASLAIRAGVTIAGKTYRRDTPVHLGRDLEPGGDYCIYLGDRIPSVGKKPPGKSAVSDILLGGFHFAPGGNAKGSSGGDAKPCINPQSLHDLHFRPACSDPRGMTFVEKGRFWADIYLCAADHLAQGTSRFGVVYATHRNPPEKPGGGRFEKMDFVAAQAVMAHHGKQLMSAEEFYAYAAGVTENSSADDRPPLTGIDPARTSSCGGMQATGNIWSWGVETRENSRPSLFGGSWLGRSDAGSRCAVLVYWPGYSGGPLGARGRSDHLQLA